MGDGTVSLLGFVLATVGILALAWWVSRWIAIHGASLPGASLPPGQERFRVVGQVPLGRGERLALVRFQDRCLLLGVTEHSITLLREVEADEAAEWLAESKRPPDFADLLGSVLRRRDASDTDSRQ